MFSVLGRRVLGNSNRSQFFVEFCRKGGKRKWGSNIQKAVEKEEKSSSSSSSSSSKLQIDQPIRIYSNPHGAWDRFIFLLLSAQVVITTGAVLYITTPIQEYIPIPQSFLDRFLPVEDPHDMIAQDTTQNTARKWVIAIIIGWVASCVAIYFKRISFMHNVTNAEVIPYEKGFKLKIEYFFRKQKTFRSQDMIREMHISEKEWGLVFDDPPKKPGSTYFIFQEKNLTKTSKSMLLSLMHHNTLSEAKMENYDHKTKSNYENTSYVFGQKE